MGAAQAGAVTVVIPARFRGPTQSGNGGYSCGLLAEALGGVAEVTLRAPPPLDTPLHRTIGDDGVARLVHDGQTIAEAKRTDGPWPAPPAVPDVETIAAAEHRYAGHRAHDYPECFACGPARAADDGLCIFSGPVADGVVAARWHVDASLAGADCRVTTPVLWAAIDCAGYWAAVEGLPERPRMLLGRMAARFTAPVAAGDTCIVLGWRERIDGRKHHAGTALFGMQGHCLGQSRQTWIALRGDG
ncbi:hypothetical protein [Sinimarinibacterium flocculans]|uniref:hypothetical protein n=1 Tax=Sinimarinibacterium flocculans TaxID=985250 RepID=UPI000D756DA7|nr:hypothetical protein [Sinimarinibacterium flocculans]